MLRKSQSNLDTNLEIMRLFYDPIARDPAIKYAHNRAQTARRSLIRGRAEPAWPCIKTKPGKRAFVRDCRASDLFGDFDRHVLDGKFREFGLKRVIRTFCRFL